MGLKQKYRHDCERGSGFPGKSVRVVCLKQGRLAIEEDVSDALTWSCSSLSFIEGLDRKLMEELRIPVVNPIKAAVRIAELCIDFGITQSKLTYPAPNNLMF